MKRIAIYSLLYCLICLSCEEIYVPDLEDVDDALVVDARIVYGKSDNKVYLSSTVGFNAENSEYKLLAGGKISIIDNNEQEHKLPELSTGVFGVDFDLLLTLNYRMTIEYNGEIYESEIESVPEIPALDTVYGEAGKKVLQDGELNNADDLLEVEGLQLYGDIAKQLEMPYNRFTARLVMQYRYDVEVIVFGEPSIETMFAWTSFFPQEGFNIASPPEFSSSTAIIKHPLYFLPKNGATGAGQTFDGWILILYHNRISQNAINYYDDLNSQLGSEGRLFDPMYIQARSNIKCISSDDKLILGNFEIARRSETRYFVNYISSEHGYKLEQITEFYNIPFAGEQLMDSPEWWGR